MRQWRNVKLHNGKFCFSVHLLFVEKWFLDNSYCESYGRVKVNSHWMRCGAARCGASPNVASCNNNIIIIIIIYFFKVG